ncbi:GntR family transcriptional regulator [Brenneria tiliae]|uniref:GntR family transcriptional regulator n=1 Tax=Brenneria tiliae TaxID=2914984 RepID=UPI002014B1B3|nr:GntR family transcriptional regulator [Brenneria tiliae]MCL2895873.1 GntR family transcriptional regulator [Brenneria tiliae]MCL2900413.1 GntR family transcriptional regulator [Brenneria tiliae]
MNNIIVEKFKNEFTLNFASDIPLYKQIENFIISQIRSGIFKNGEKMISENQLCSFLKVSRTTTRQAMNSLYDKGFIVRIRGKGSFVQIRKIQRDINKLYNFTESIISVGLEPSSIVIKHDVIKANDVIAKKLNLPIDNKYVFKLVRVRKANESPILLETTYIPYILCQNIEKINFENRSLYNVLKNIYSLDVDYAEETIESILIDNSTTCSSLKCTHNMPGFLISRLSYLNDGTVLEYTHSITRSDKCIFKITLSNNKKEKFSFSKNFNT